MEDEADHPASEARRNRAAGFATGFMLGVAAMDGLLGLVAGLLMGVGMSLAFARASPAMKYPPHLIRRMALSAAVYVLALVFCLRLLRDDMDPTLRLALALAPALPGLVLVASVGMAIARLDEMQRRIQVEAMAIAFGGTLLVTVTWGLLARVGVAQPNWLWVGLVMMGLWLAGKLWMLWRYR
jgi:hypothetical protein